MRAAVVLFILSFAAVAAADPPDHSLEVAAQVRADIKAGDAKGLAADLMLPLRFAAGSLFSPECRKQFGGRREVTNVAELPAVATCVLGIDGIADYTVVGHSELTEAPTGDHVIHVLVPRGARSASMLLVVPKRDPNAPASVTPTVLNAYRISGQTQIVPDARTQDAIRKAGTKRVIATVKMCLEDTGAVSKVELVRDTGFPAYDTLIVDTVKTWKYKPYLVDGVATAACTAIMFIYQQR